MWPAREASRNLASAAVTVCRFRCADGTYRCTGVANRTVFMDRLQQALRRLDRKDSLDPVEQNARYAVTLELLRAAHHDPTEMSHALSLGRSDILLAE